MTLPVSGAISFNAINVELGVAGTTQANINQATYRTLAGVPSGQISLSNFYGKSNRATASFTFSSNTANASLNLSALSGYVAGTTDITVTINGGVYLYATSTGNYGLNLSGATSGDTVTIVNNGYIMGMGGSGVDGASGKTTGYEGGNGGPALNLNIGVNPTINNTNGSAYIGGGGGAGGGMYQVSYSITSAGGGAGGAGGGNSGQLFSSNFGQPSKGLGGGIGSSGTNGGTSTTGGGTVYGSGGGGRIFPSVRTTRPGSIGPGLGGSGGGTSFQASGYGGGPLEVGSAGAASPAGGGGWGASGGQGGGGLGASFAGGAGGKAVNLNGRSVTWVSGNTSRVYGAIS